MMGWICSAGRLCRARISLDEIKLPNTDGIRAKSRANPAVRAKEMMRYFAFVFNSSGSSKIFFSASIASRGMVNSAMTRMEATVRNFAYIGT